ncbi:hypothetical protein [Paenibacillus piri]|uniref:DUF4368 domain-containing protein n=1 Tax=Paenibacillus piri TaxID=2547395 RepID=A0A4R5KEZ6_9BACL|nr:hypothetical protein [Paenibacillus piri]TDF93826.1 hypothetical protein E1757_25935 [Paenibacillus piri]
MSPLYVISSDRNPTIGIIRRIKYKEIYDETIIEITREQEALKSCAAELEKLLSNEESSTQYMQSFQSELSKFVKLDVPDEETLRDILHNLIRKIEINADGEITINYNFMNPLTGFLS